MCVDTATSFRKSHAGRQCGDHSLQQGDCKCEAFSCSSGHEKHFLRVQHVQHDKLLFYWWSASIHWCCVIEPLCCSNTSPQIVFHNHLSFVFRCFGKLYHIIFLQCTGLSPFKKVETVVYNCWFCAWLIFVLCSICYLFPLRFSHWYVQHRFYRAFCICCARALNVNNLTYFFPFNDEVNLYNNAW